MVSFCLLVGFDQLTKFGSFDRLLLAHRPVNWLPYRSSVLNWLAHQDETVVGSNSWRRYLSSFFLGGVSMLRVADQHEDGSARPCRVSVPSFTRGPTTIIIQLSILASPPCKPQVVFTVCCGGYTCSTFWPLRRPRPLFVFPCISFIAVAVATSEATSRVTVTLSIFCCCLLFFFFIIKVKNSKSKITSSRDKPRREVFVFVSVFRCHC